MMHRFRSLPVKSVKPANVGVFQEHRFVPFSTIIKAFGNVTACSMFHTDSPKSEITVLSFSPTVVLLMPPCGEPDVE